MQLSKNQPGIQGQNDLGRSKGRINPHSSTELGRRHQASFCPAGFNSALKLTSGCYFPVLKLWTSSHVTFSPHVLLVVCVPSCIWPYILSSVTIWSAQACWKMTYRGHKEWPTGNALPSDGWLSFQCCPLTWSTRGRMILTPHGMICWNIWRHHSNASPEDLPWP